MVFGTMHSFCTQILTEIMAASWIFDDIVGVVRPNNVWPCLFFIFLFFIKKKKKKKKKNRRVLKLKDVFIFLLADMSTKSKLYYH